MKILGEWGSSERMFTQTLLTRIDFAWRILLGLSISLGYILGVYFIGTNYFYSLFRFERVSNTTARLESVFIQLTSAQEYGFCATIYPYRFYFNDPSFPIAKKPGIVAVKELYEYADSIVNTLYDVIIAAIRLMLLLECQYATRHVQRGW